MRGGLRLGLLLGGLMLAGAAAAPAEAEMSAKTLYMLHCSGCHRPDGMGSKIGRIPPFPGVVGLFLEHPEGPAYLSTVPGVMNSGLPPEKAAAVLNYVLEEWGPGPHQAITAEQVRAARQTPVDDVVLRRARIAADLAAAGRTLAGY